jgi:hypothetical protein
MTLTPDQMRARAEQALRTGKITSAEYDLFIASLSKPATRPAARPAPTSAPEPATARRSTVLAACALIIIAFGAALLLSHGWLGGQFGGIGGISGMAIFDQQDELPATLMLDHSENVTLNITNTTTLAITGTLTNGSAQVYLRSADGRRLVYAADTLAGYRVIADKTSYALNETVRISVEPAGTDYTLYLVTPTAREPIDANYTTSVPGDFAIDALINASGTIAKASTSFAVREDADPANDVMRDSATSISFAKSCAETCVMDPTGDAALVLEIELSGGAQLAITNITASRQQENHAPALARNIPDVLIRPGATVAINLSGYFSDADGDQLSYNYMSAPETTMSIEGSILSITGISPGSNQSMVYASDGATLVVSNLFTVTVENAQGAAPNSTAGDNLSQNMTSAQNATAGPQNATAGTALNATLNQTAQNGTIQNRTAQDDTVQNATAAGDLTQNATGGVPQENATDANATAPQSDGVLDCSSDDPNKRPAACLYQNTNEYFPDDEIFLQDLDRQNVARFTQIGNLLLKGRVVEHSTAVAGPRDFRIGYVDRDGNSIATIWIDSATGDLHLRGALIEENANLMPPPGSYSLMNKRDIFLAYADQQQGDLVVRGNVIPYKLK